MIVAVTWAKDNDLVGTDMVWYKEGWDRGTVLEKNKARLVWDFKFNLRKTATARRPDLIVENKEKQKVWINNITCPQ